MIRKDYLKSKITVPHVYHKLLPRKNIAATIDSASLGEAICLIAPYGCGKTLAAVSWLRENNRNTAWLTLDETDNSEQAFFASLSAAMLRLTGWKGIADNILSDPKYIANPWDFLWETISTAESNAHDKILVLDMLRFISDPTLLRRIKELVSVLLGHWRIIITSRTELPSVFNELMLKRHICLITLNDLSFSPEETAEFFDINDFTVPSEDIMRIHSETEGWPASLNVILTISRAAVYRFPSMLRGIRDYCPALDILEDYVQRNKETGYSRIDDEVSLWRLDIVRAEYAYELENFREAEVLIKNVITEVEGQQITDLYFVCIALLVRIVRAAHNPKEISALTTRLETMILKTGYTFLLPRFHAFELRNRMADGIAGQTGEFEKENSAYAEKPYFYLLYQHMALVRALLSTGNYNEATMILGNLGRLCHRYNRIMDLIEVNILRAVADYGLGNDSGACRYLTEALDDARKYGFIRIFSDDARDLLPILGLLAEDQKDDYVNNIIISCKKTLARAGIKISRKNQPQSELTKTELKILKTLDSAMSYKELALDNGIKVSTVKSHIRSIYSKLDVANRTSAVMATRSMGVID